MKTEKEVQRVITDNLPFDVLLLWHEIKQRYPDVLLVFRIGDHWEAYETDAEAISHVCNGHIQKGCFRIAADESEATVRKLLKAGYRVAMCDDVEKTAASLRKRERII